MTILKRTIFVLFIATACLLQAADYKPIELSEDHDRFDTQPKDTGKGILL